MSESAGDGVAGTIRIAAALIDDVDGRLLLVRKAGTSVFMQAGGKIEPGERAIDTLVRELAEEIGFRLDPATVPYLGRFRAPAANEAGCMVEADIFHVRAAFTPAATAEIAEAIWIEPGSGLNDLALAPVTRDHVLPLAQSLRGHP